MLKAKKYGKALYRSGAEKRKRQNGEKNGRRAMPSSHFTPDRFAPSVHSRGTAA